MIFYGNAKDYCTRMRVERNPVEYHNLPQVSSGLLELVLESFTGKQEMWEIIHILDIFTYHIFFIF